MQGYNVIIDIIKWKFYRGVTNKPPYSFLIKVLPNAFHVLFERESRREIFQKPDVYKTEETKAERAVKPWDDGAARASGIWRWMENALEGARKKEKLY